MCQDNRRKMKPIEENTHIFIIRIWRESREIEGAPPEWRGVIEHVPGGNRRYIRSLDEISAFITPYLDQMGVKSSVGWRVRRWLNQRWLLLKRSN